jgi:Glycosyl hydrolases family 43
MDNRLATCARRRWRAPRSTVSRLELVLLGVVALLLAGGGVLAASAATAHPAGGAVGYEPPVTRTPDAPATIIAKVHNIDLSGGSLEVQNGHYLLFTSTAFGDDQDNVPVFVGRPGDWSAPVDALPVLPAWALPVAQSGGGTTWQPEVFRFGSRYVLYYSATVRGSQPRMHCLGTATSRSMIGPYVASARPIVCQTNEGGDIDAQVVMDGTSPTSQPYLIWKSDNNSGPGHGTDLMWSQRLDANGLALVGSPAVIFGTGVAPAWAGPIVEAPQLVLSPFGGWWLFYSGGGGFSSPRYAIGVAKCKSVTGPCTAVGTQPLITSNRQGTGPGEETFYRTTSSDWLLYDPWHSGIYYNWFRPVAAARIGWTSAGPYVAQAGSFPSP